MSFRILYIQKNALNPPWLWFLHEFPIFKQEINNKKILGIHSSPNTLNTDWVTETNSSWCSAGWSTKKVLQKLPDQFIDFKLTKFEIKGVECYKCLNTEWMETVRSYPPGEVFRHSDSDMLNDTWIEKVYNLGSKLDHRLSDVLNSDHFHLLLTATWN